MKSQILFPLESTFNFIESSRGCFLLEHSSGGSKPPEKGGGGGRAVIRTMTKVKGGGVGQPPGRPLQEPPLHSSSSLHSNVLELYLK